MRALKKQHETKSIALLDWKKILSIKRKMPAERKNFSPFLQMFITTMEPCFVEVTLRHISSAFLQTVFKKSLLRYPMVHPATQIPFSVCNYSVSIIVMLDDLARCHLQCCQWWKSLHNWSVHPFFHSVVLSSQNMMLPPLCFTVGKIFLDATQHSSTPKHDSWWVSDDLLPILIWIIKMIPGEL